MTAVIAIFVSTGISLLITRVGASALAVTGLSREVSRFQARSAFFGVGFTTSEAEAVVNHPVRRRIVLWLMLLGNIGVISVLGSVVLSFAGNHGQTWERLGIVAGGLLVLGLLARWANPLIERLIDLALQRWTDLDTRDYAGLLRLTGDFSILELKVEDGDWVADRTLGELKLRDEGVVVLGITRADGRWVGAPDRATTIHVGDTLVVYGREHRVCELDARRAGGAGDRAHVEAVGEQDALEASEGAQDRAAMAS